MAVALLVAIAIYAGGAAGQSSPPPGAAAMSRYRVTVALFPGDDPLTVARQLSATYRGTIEPMAATAGGASTSIVLSASSASARLMSADPRVARIEELPAEHEVDDGANGSAAKKSRPQMRAETTEPRTTLLELGSYQYDGAGNIKSIGPDKFVYDAFGRLTSGTAGSEKKQEYTYDAFGNILTITTTVGVTSTQIKLAVDPATNRISKPGDEYNARGSFDAVGDMTATALGDSYSYDGLGMVTRSSNGYAEHFYVYTPNDERIASVIYEGGAKQRTDWTLRDAGGAPLRRYRESAAGLWTWEQDYIYQGGKLLASEGTTPEQRRHYFLDHLGTPRLITDGNGYEISRHTYYPFGREATPLTSTEPLKFTGHERDFMRAASGELDDHRDYMHARYYDNGWGRFLSVDPSGRSMNPARPQTWNRYSYSLNNPANLVDPTGLWATKRTLGVGGTVHQNAIDRALPFMESRWRAILKQQQIVADREQGTSLSYRHAMRAPGQTAAEARDLANAYVRKHMLLAIEAQSEGSFVTAMKNLGLAIHTLQDETSPMHEGFQEWEGAGHVMKASEHVAGENYDPGKGSELDIVTRKAWDWFVSGKVPEDVFEPSKDSYCHQCPTTIFGIAVQ